jgi:hypothetical protein
MREPKGPMGRIADTITGTMRRRQRDREPRVLIYDGAGLPRTVPPGTEAYGDLVETAQRLVDLAGGGQPEPEAEPVQEP